VSEKVRPGLWHCSIRRRPEAVPARATGRGTGQPRFRIGYWPAFRGYRGFLHSRENRKIALNIKGLALHGVACEAVRD
jgi:hypothetical protein